MVLPAVSSAPGAVSTVRPKYHDCGTPSRKASGLQEHLVAANREPTRRAGFTRQVTGQATRRNTSRRAGRGMHFRPRS